MHFLRRPIRSVSNRLPNVRHIAFKSKNLLELKKVIATKFCGKLPDINKLLIYLCKKIDDEKNLINMIRFLIDERGANPRCLVKQSGCFYTALDFCCRANKFDVAKVLIEEYKGYCVLEDTLIRCFLYGNVKIGFWLQKYMITNNISFNHDKAFRYNILYIANCIDDLYDVIEEYGSFDEILCPTNKSIIKIR